MAEDLGIVERRTVAPGRGVVERAALARERAEWKRAGRTVVWTNGCFDLLHVGHIRSLEMAKALGDVLVVGVNSDSSVQALKGPSRPIVSEVERAEVVAALACVDRVILFGETTPEAALAFLKPDIHCKGEDYAPPHGKPIPEAELVRSYGGRVAFLPMVEATSTTELVRWVVESAGTGA